MALAVAPFAAQAETWNIYGWQNHSWEFVDLNGKNFDRIAGNAGNIGFAASMDAGNGISVNVQCEQFTMLNEYAGGSGWCNRNSKIGLSHAQMGEIMFATWLLPYNEGVAQWVDPFYDAGSDSHTSIMGSVGANTAFYNPGQFEDNATDSGPLADFSAGQFSWSGAGYDTGFNRRQEQIIQYWSPNWNGFVFRFAWTMGQRDETKGLNGHEVDPVIRSSSLAYTNGPFWAAVTWQDHEDWTADAVGSKDCSASGHCMESSDAESFRVAGRYIMDMGDGVSVQISAMWEDLEYEFNGVTSVDQAMAAFGYGGFAKTGNLSVMDTEIRSQKTLGLIHELFGDADESTSGDSGGDGISNSFVGVLGTDLSADSPTPITSLRNTAKKDNALTKADEASKGNSGISIETARMTGSGESVTTFNTTRNQLINAVRRLEAISKATISSGTTTTASYMQLPTDGGAGAATATDITNITAAHIADAKLQYDMLKGKAMTNARGQKAGNVKVERDAWMVSGKIKFGGPVDFRFSYMDADDLEVSCGACSGDWKDTAADAWNVGMFYTMPGGTELRLTYSEVDNDDNGTYGQGISTTGLGVPGNEVEMFAVGIVHWFD